MAVIVTVREYPGGERDVRHSDATGFDVDSDRNLVLRGEGKKVAVYANDFWLSAAVGEATGEA